MIANDPAAGPLQPAEASSDSSTMLKQIGVNWKNNYGYQLSVIGAIAGVAMCFLWYKDLLPEIRFSRPIPLARRFIGSGVTCYFIANIECTGTEENGGVTPTSGGVVVFSHDDYRNEGRSPMVIRQFSLDNQYSATVVIELPPGAYAAYAFLDTNDNERLDIDSETGESLEPLRITGADGSNKLSDLQEGAFALSFDRPYLCMMNLDVSQLE